MTIPELKQIRADLQANYDKATTPAEVNGLYVLIEESYALEREILANAMEMLGMTGDAMRARASAAITHAKFETMMNKATTTKGQ